MTTRLLDEILLDLENPVETTRTRAVVGLVRYNDISVIPHLERVAERDESAQVRYLARKGLKLLKDKALGDEQRRCEADRFAGDAEQTVKALIDSGQGEDRRRGFELAARLNDPSLYPLLEEAYTREETPFLKPLMIRVLTVVGADDALPHVGEALKSPEHRLRAAAVEAAALIQDEELLENVVPLLQDKDNRVAANAALALKDYGSIKVLVVLKKMLESSEPGRRDSAAFALAQLRSEAALPLLAKATRDVSRAVRAKAVRGLESLAEAGIDQAGRLLDKMQQEDEEGIADYFALASEDVAAGYLAHEDFAVRLRTIKEIVKAGDRTRKPVLKEAIKQERDTFVKSALVRAIGELGGEDDLETLLPYLIDREPRVRANAVEAIGILARSVDDLKQLLPALKDKNNRVRANAMVALKNAYPDRVFEALTAMAADGGVRMKLSAAYACLEIATTETIGILTELARERDLRISEKAVSSLELLRDQGHAAARDALARLARERDDLSSTDSFVAFEDGSVIELTPGDEEKTADGGEPVVPGQLSIVSSLKAEYGIDSEVNLLSRDSAPTQAAVTDTLDMDEVPGSRPATSKYVVAGEVGRGGMGTILNAFDTDIRREVAMKVITSRKESSRQFLERFVEEAQVQGQLEHPNICPVHELGVDSDGRVYFTMKMVKGASLADMIKQAAADGRGAGGRAGDPQWLTSALNIFLSICNGIAFAHSKGVIHRDLKPDNIMVGDFGEVYVMDWGLAKIMGREDDRRDGLVITGRTSHDDVMKTMSGAVVGTPAYMPPEQSRGIVEEMDERSDIYSLGALLYELLTLQRPFTGNNPWTVLEKVAKEAPVPPSLRCQSQGLSGELDSIVLKCMSKEKDRRYRTVRDLRREIELYLSGRPIGAMDYSLWQVFRKWVARNRVLAAASLAVLLILMVSFGVSYVRISRSEKEAWKQKVKAERAADRARSAQEAEARQRIKAEENEAEAKRQRDMAESSMLKSEIRLAMVAEEKKQVGEAIKKYREIRRVMIGKKKAVYPYIDLKIWKAKHAESRYKEVTHALVMKTTAEDEADTVQVTAAACLDISPDGRLLAVGCADGTVKLWDPRTGRPVGQLGGHSGPVTRLAFSRDGTRLATGDFDLTIRIYSTRPWRQLAAFRGSQTPPGLAFDTTVIGLDFSPGGKKLVSCNVGERGIFVWDIFAVESAGSVKLEKKLSDHFRGALSVSFSGDGRSLVSGSRDAWVRLWEVDGDYRSETITGHRGDVSRAIFSPDGSLVASASSDNTIKLWNIRKEKEIAVLRGHGAPVIGLDFSPDGKTLISGGMDKTVRFWDIESLKQISLYKEQDAVVSDVAFSPGGLTAFSSFSDGTVLVWSLRQQQEVITVKDQFFDVSRVAFSPDGQLLAVGTEAEFEVPVMLLDTATGELTASLMGHIRGARALSFSPDGRLLASGGDFATLIFWDVSTGAPLSSLNAQTGEQNDVFSSVLKTIGKNIRQLMAYQPRDDNDPVSSIAFSPDGRLLAAASYFDQEQHDYPTVSLWDPETYQRVHRFPECRRSVNSIAFSPDGRLLAAGSFAGPIFLWDAETRKLAAELPGNAGGAAALAFSPDGRYLAAGGFDSTVILWNMDTRQPAGTLTGHLGVVSSLSFHPGGRLLASGSYDTDIVIWELKTGEAIITLQDHATEVTAVDFSPDGRLLASGEKNKTVKIWRFGDAVEPLKFED